MKKLVTYSIALLPFVGIAQKNKVQTAWRSLNDYEATVRDGKPDLVYLNKAKDAIDIALANEETKNQGKTHAYKARISYAFYQSELTAELKKAEAVSQDKNERVLIAYGNAPLTNFELANEEVNKIKELDPKYMETIQEGLTKGTSMLGEDDVKFALLVQQIKMEGENIAQGKYKAKKYDEAADYFYKTGFLKTMIFKAKDTASFMNACIAASKIMSNANYTYNIAKNANTLTTPEALSYEVAKKTSTSKIIEYNKKMIDFKVASPYNYDNIFNANLSKGDTSAAMAILAKGRTAFPNDMNLLNSETNMFLARGKQAEALTNLKTSIEKDPNNSVLYLVTGNIYDNMANPKEKGTGKDLPKPKEFDEYFKTAETNYTKAVELSTSNKEIQYNSLYNLGAMYNNYGGYLQNKKVEGKITDLQKLQKEQDAKSQEYYKKAIPLLEKVLGIKNDDKATMVALRKLYLITGDEAKGKEMNERIKGGK